MEKRQKVCAYGYEWNDRFYTCTATSMIGPPSAVDPSAYSSYSRICPSDYCLNPGFTELSDLCLACWWVYLYGGFVNIAPSPPTPEDCPSQWEFKEELNSCMPTDMDFYGNLIECPIYLQFSEELNSCVPIGLLSYDN